MSSIERSVYGNRSFPEAERDRLYGLFEKYRAWLAETKLFDANLLAPEWHSLAPPGTAS